MGFVVRLSYAGGVKRSVKSFNVFSEGPEDKADAMENPEILDALYEGHRRYINEGKPQDGAAVRGRNETELYFYCVMAKENRKFIL